MLGLGLSLGLLPPIRGKVSLHALDQLQEDTVLWEGGQRARLCSREPGAVIRLTLLAPCPHWAWYLASSGPPAHLFCALVTYESSPSLGPQLVPDTPWGLPVKLLALRILQYWARHPWPGLRGGQDHQSLPLAQFCTPIPEASWGHRPQAGWAYTDDCSGSGLF